MTIVIFFIFGLIIGSFINVLVYRLHVAEDIFFDRSRCRHCKKIIAWYDNIPLISFILLKFRCRECEKKISWQYPLVELATGILFAVAGFFFFDPADTSTWSIVIYFLGIILALVTIFVYDLLYLEIPDVILWPAVVWAAAFSLFFSLNHDAIGIRSASLDMQFFLRMIAASVAFIFLFFLSFVSKEKWMGRGDAYLAILLGIIVGWPNILLALFLSFFLGALCGIILVLAHQKKMSGQIPFAPFLIIGTGIALFWGDCLVSWYMRLIL